jgi:hypothetical protein
MRDIIETAHKAGIDDPESDWMFWNAMERFAALVRADAIAGEREACAKVCDTTPPYPFRPSIEAAHAIRERSANKRARGEASIRGETQ